MHTDRVFPMVQSKQSFEIPLILEEPYDLAETAALHYGPDAEGGLLAGAEHSTAFLSMSGYGKSHPDDADGMFHPFYPDAALPTLKAPANASLLPADYDSKSYPESNYVYTEPHPARQYSITSIPAPEASSAESMPYIATLPFQPRGSFDAPHALYSDYRTRELPTVLSWEPSKGSLGTKVFVSFQSPYDLTEAPLLSFPLVFGNRRQLSEITKKSHHPGQYYRYTVAADVPLFSTTAWHTSPVKLAMQMNDETGHIIGSIDIGDFYYTDILGPPAPQPAKRKTPEDAPERSRGPMKRTVSTQQIRSKGEDEYAMIPYAQRGASAYSPYLHPSVGHAEPSPRTRQGSIPFGNTGTMQSSMKGLSPGTPVWNPAYAGARISQSPGLGISAPKVRTSVSSADASTPQLVRTTLQHSPSPATTSTGLIQAGAPFNPYAMYPSKAVLKIDGNLDSMAETSWTMEEWEAKRRIVQFQRSQSGSTITTQFEPVAIDQRPPNSICISCIWWEEKKECFVTSVDTIYLLESLVAVRFTVEEKNRIRRNLEGFRPLTVSKAKADSEEFFKIIMGFPNPKPRNIEKDVKVFPWKILAHALKKIIGKYVCALRLLLLSFLTIRSRPAIHRPREQSSPSLELATAVAGTLLQPAPNWSAASDPRLLHARPQHPSPL